MATSTIWTLKGNLLAQLRARPGLAGVQITWGIPAAKLEPDWICLRDVVDPAGQETAALGHMRREERYELRIVISVVRQFSEDQEVVAERARVLAAEIEDQLRSDPTVNGAVRTALVVGLSLEEPVDSKTAEREARVTVRVACRQRI